jgi:formylglycine-generating enzyme required for sulfatase activity
MKNLLKISMIVAVFGLLFTNCTRPVESVTLDQTTLTMRVGTTATLVPAIEPKKADDKSVTWSTSDAKIATVENGTVTALTAGKATITVTTVDGQKTATCQVTVEYGYIENDYNIVLVPVEGGTFIMGADDNDSDASLQEKPAHQVTLKSFNIMKYEVTQKQWYDVMGSWPAGFEPTNTYGKGDNYPVYNISWSEVQEFITKLNQKTGKKYRLPTEAEWEFAARGGTQSQGYKYSGGNVLDNVAWNINNATGKTHPVGGKQSNEIGIYDMSGNVSEWCGDWFAYYTNTIQTNPTGPSEGQYRVVRNGSWYSAAKTCRMVYRDKYAVNAHYNYLGFRLVLP